ncbi:MAG: carbohydrate kinase family protein, partial [Phycisphaerae bacterium]|nr:carbohydrate kinase family protein [Phycisphaerae bacterium]
MTDMQDEQVQVVVAGHICLDIIPTFSELKGDLAAAFVPGNLINVGPAVTATGGAVSNTGLALHRLG